MFKIKCGKLMGPLWQINFRGRLRAKRWMSLLQAGLSAKPKATAGKHRHEI